ncbi:MULTISPECIES: hypothetical protein [unclassified Mesorhizobium]|uniref:hypothetical protein n=1 Tax=unclassified Mesorhizobium TaxID=325217 RepID=UPI001093B13B|nr:MULTISPECIES: hypothetical protein [unclassified Mesorhizobium]TGT90860.1 hypothetical protein EN804_05865 [Mesorhizobium sp. M8A.F.Ca.ET.161.01.1.1]TGV43860.1 hypothetical protein EN785_07680 [Mesorhizobium sp. M8A.F.Ca.ET.142.01.1.1]
MSPDIFPAYRHLVVLGEKRFPARIVDETPFVYCTPVGAFDKSTRRKWGDRSVSFEGPFTAEGDMENRP